MEGKGRKTQAYLPVYPSLFGCWGHFLIPDNFVLVKPSGKMAEAGFPSCSLSPESGTMSATISPPGDVFLFGGVAGASEEPKTSYSETEQLSPSLPEQ